MANVKCFGCGQISHFKRDCEETKKKKASKKRAKAKRAEERSKSKQEGKARNTQDDLSGDESGSDDESVNAAWIEGTEEPIAGRVRVDQWIIDGGATAHCTGDIQTFENLDTSFRGSLGTCQRLRPVDASGFRLRVRYCNNPTFIVYHYYYYLLLFIILYYCYLFIMYIYRVPSRLLVVCFFFFLFPLKC